MMEVAFYKFQNVYMSMQPHPQNFIEHPGIPLYHQNQLAKIV